MPRFKNETLSIRTTAEVKDLLRQAAERERRSVASMVEALVVAYAKRHRLHPKTPIAKQKENGSTTAAALPPEQQPPRLPLNEA